MHNPKVSVLIPAYNYAHYLSEAIDSVLAQTYSDFELIIVDNCSTDNTEEIVNEYKKNDNRVKFVRNNENIGMYRNYNQALLLATGDYIKFLNADDKFESTLLEKFVAIFDNNPTVSIVTSYRQYFGAKTEILKPPHIGLIEAKTAILSSLRHGNWIGEPTTVIFRRSNLNLGLFDISLLMFADQDMWLRHLRVGNLYVIDEVLSYFRIHEEQGTVYLNNETDKLLFTSMQYAEYLRNAILNNRFGYTLYSINPDQCNKVLNSYSQMLEKLLQKNSNVLNPLHYLYQFAIVKKLVLFSIIPLKVFNYAYKLNQTRKKIKALLKGKQ